MRHVKRYSNRKLYDQDDRGYTTLRGLAEKIRRGDEVIVVDHVTGADITSQTMTQIISSEAAAAAEEGKSSPVSVEVLARVIRDGIQVNFGKWHPADPEQAKGRVDRSSTGEYAGQDAAETRDRIEAFEKKL